MALEEAIPTTNKVFRTSPVFGERVCKVTGNSMSVLCNGGVSTETFRSTQKGHNSALGGGEVWGVSG